MRLEVLQLWGMGVQMLEAMQAAAAAAAGGWHAFLPALREVHLGFSDDDEDEGALVAVMGQGAWFSGVRKLSLFSDDCPVRAGRAVAAALATGAFASVSDMALYGFCRGDVGALVSALAASDCARCLMSLKLARCHIADVDEIVSLGAAIGAGRFPALARLELCYGTHHAGTVQAFAEALTPVHVPPLEALNVELDSLQDVDVIALAAALRDGRLGWGLEKLQLAFTGARITIAGVMALSDALVAGRQHVQRLEELKFMAPLLNVEQIRAFLERALAACPRLTRVMLRCGNLSSADKAALRAIMKEKRGPRGIVHVWW
jgi:hypothetical protein